MKPTTREVLIEFRNWCWNNNVSVHIKDSDVDLFLSEHPIEEKEDKWISVNDRLPSDDKDVTYLIYTISGTIDVGWMSLKRLAAWGIDSNEITHWQPLPPPIETKQ